MMKRFLFGLISIAAFGLTPRSSCVASAQNDEQFIQEKWRLEGEHPKQRYKHGMIYLRDTTADHPYCCATYINIVQSYSGGVSFAASRPFFAGRISGRVFGGRRKVDFN